MYYNDKILQEVLRTYAYVVDDLPSESLTILDRMFSGPQGRTGYYNYDVIEAPDSKVDYLAKMIRYQMAHCTSLLHIDQDTFNRFIALVNVGSFDALYIQPILKQVPSKTLISIVKNTEMYEALIVLSEETGGHLFTILRGNLEGTCNNKTTAPYYEIYGLDPTLPINTFNSVPCIPSTVINHWVEPMLAVPEIKNREDLEDPTSDDL